MTPHEIIATAMLLGGALDQGHSSANHKHRYWRCLAADNLGTGYYIQKHDAAAAYLKRRGYEIDFTGNLVKI